MGLYSHARSTITFSKRRGEERRHCVRKPVLYFMNSSLETYTLSYYKYIVDSEGKKTDGVINCIAWWSTEQINMARRFIFVDKCINLVMPRIKDWPGIKDTTGDSARNINFGFDREGAILLPEVEVNYDVSHWFSYLIVYANNI
jgi:hypothetical protein